MDNYKYIFTYPKNGVTIKIYSIELEIALPHRLDGPAIEHSDGKKIWFYMGKKINCSSQEEFEKALKLKAFW